MFTQYYLTLGKPKYDDDAIVCFSNSWDKYKGMFFIPTNFNSFIFQISRLIHLKYLNGGYLSGKSIQVGEVTTPRR
jgi:hypothetical protein